MAKTALDITDADIAVYRETARRRQEAHRAETEARRARGWELARQAATLLRERYGAGRIAVYGSLARGSGFTRWSDVDLFAEGIDPRQFLRAMGEVYDLDPEIEVNLAPLEQLRPNVLASALADAVDL